MLDSGVLHLSLKLNLPQICYHLHLVSQARDQRVAAEEHYLQSKPSESKAAKLFKGKASSSTSTVSSVDMDTDVAGVVENIEESAEQVDLKVLEAHDFDMAM